MAVAFDAVGPSSSGAGNAHSATLSWTHTAVGGPVCLLVGVALGDQGGADGGFDFSVTCDSTPMTLVGGPVHGNSSTFGFIKVYGLTGITAGAHSIAVTATGGTPSGMSGGSVSFTGAAGFGTPYTATGNSATPNVSVTSSTSGNIIFGFAGFGSNSVPTATSPATLQFGNAELAACIDNSGGETSPSTGSAVTAGFGTAGDFWAIIALEVTAIQPVTSVLIPPGFQSPMAFTAFPPRPQGGALVSDADTGTGADTGSVAVAVSDADTGTGADTGSVAVAVSDADTGTGADTGSVAVAVSDADTGTGADTGSVAVAVSGADTGAAADTGSVVTPPSQLPPPLIPPGFQSPAAFTAFMATSQPAAVPLSTVGTLTAASTGTATLTASDTRTGGPGG